MLSSKDLNFIEDHLKCGICHEILIEPVELGACAHLFCEFCMDLWLKKHSSCPLCRATLPEDPDDPGQPVVFMADGDQVIDYVVKSLPPVVQEERRAAKRLREEAIEHEAAAKRRKLGDNKTWAQRHRSCVETILSLALVAVLGSLTWLY